MKVVKFGGTSVADAKQILKVVGIVTSDSARRIVVVSAPGKRHSKDAKVTDGGFEARLPAKSVVVLEIEK